MGALLWANTIFLGGLAMLYIAQFTIGLGTGSLGVTRSYVVEQAPPKVRTYMLARLSALQYAGFAATPLLGSSLVVAGGTISTIWKFALPAYLIVALAVLCLALLVFVFEDIKQSYEEQADSTRSPLLQSKAPEAAKAGNTRHFAPTDGPASPAGHHPGTMANLVYISVAIDDEEVPAVGEQSFSGDESFAFAGSYCGSPITSPPGSPVMRSAEAAVKAMEAGAAAEGDTALSEALLLEQRKVFLLMILLNFTTRGVIAVYETQTSRILLDKFCLSQIALGAVVSVAGVVGTLQLAFFKQIWTSHFSDFDLMCGGLCLVGFSQLLVMNLGQGLSLWQYLTALYCMYSIGYPVANSAVLGSFSTIQKAGRQAKAQGQFALMGSLARVVFPVLSGLAEQYIHETAAFSLVLLVMAVSLLGVALMMNKITFFTTAGGEAGQRSGEWVSDSVFSLSRKQLLLASVAAAMMAVSFFGIFSAV